MAKFKVGDVVRFQHGYGNYDDPSNGKTGPVVKVYEEDNGFGIEDAEYDVDIYGDGKGGLCYEAELTLVEDED